MVRGIGASLCSEAAGHDTTRWLARGIRATRNLALELFFVGTGALRGCTALQELRHMPRLAGFAGRARGRIAADLGLQLDDVDELVGLAAQLIGDHRRLRRGGRDHADAHPRRCTASTSERKSPSPENSTMWSMWPASSMASTASSISMLPLILRRQVWSTNSLVGLVTTV